MLYGEESNGRVMDVHQELKRQEFLTPLTLLQMLDYFCRLTFSSDAEIIFVRS